MASAHTNFANIRKNFIFASGRLAMKGVIMSSLKRYFSALAREAPKKRESWAR